MDIKKSLKDVIVLFVICAVFATVLAAVNSVTAPIIAEQLAGAANEAYMAVIPGAEGFEDIDLSAYELPATVKEAKRETSGKGVAIKLETTGYKPGMVLIVGVDANGVVTGSTCIASSETWGLESALGEEVVGKDIETIVDVRAGATSLTVNGYRSAVKDAIAAATIFGGGSVDIRTEEQILSDNLNAALGLEGAKFTKMFMVEVIAGVDKIYTEDNGAGYVCVIGEQFIGVNVDGAAVKVIDADTVEVTEGVDEVKASAVSAITIAAATELTDLNVADYEGIHARITAIQKTATGNYVFTIKVDGHGVKGDPMHEHASGNPYVIKVSISAEGKIIDAQTLEHTETPTWGGPQLNDGAFNSNFIGKNETESGAVDHVAGTTNTTNGYKQAVLRCFAAFNILTGGAN